MYIIGRAERAPHWGVQSRFRVIYVGMYVCMYVCLSWSKKRRLNYVAKTCACSVSFGRLKQTSDTSVIHFYIR